MPKMSEKDFQAKIDNLMKKLDCTAEEAKEILMDDDDIDHGIAKDFDLSAESSKKLTSTLRQERAKHRPLISLRSDSARKTPQNARLSLNLQLFCVKTAKMRVKMWKLRTLNA